MVDKEKFAKDINVPSKEQIMIDGVDISGCLFYQSNFEEDYDVRIKHFCSNWHNSCESSNNSNCYFKQLARKTQECEELKEKYEALKLENQEGYEIVDELKQECEELKKQLMQKSEVDMFFNTPIEGWSNDPCNVCEYKGENTRYRKALDEIKEIVKINCEEICGRKLEDCNDFLCPSKNIIDIINKVKGEEC